MREQKVVPVNGGEFRGSTSQAEVVSPAASVPPVTSTRVNAYAAIANEDNDPEAISRTQCSTPRSTPRDRGSAWVM